VLTSVSRMAAATRSRLSGTFGNAANDLAPLPTSSVQAFKAYTTGAKLMSSQPIQAVALLHKGDAAGPQFRRCLGTPRAHRR
jgi:hypothetical protein